MEYYRAVRIDGLRPAFIYAARFFGMLAILGGLMFVPSILAARVGVIKYLETKLPDGSTFTLAKEGFSSNVKMPFEFGPEGAPMVLDTSVIGTTPPDMSKRAMVLGAQAAFFPRQDAGPQAVAYSGLPNFSITKADILSKLHQIGWPIVTFLALVLVLGWAISSFIGSIVYVLVMSALALLAGRYTKVLLPYKKWVAVGLHAITLPTLVTIGFSATLGRVPFVFTIIFGMFIYSVISDERSNPLVPSVVPPAEPPLGPEKP